MVVSEPLRVTDAARRTTSTPSIHGGGVSGQAGALRMAIARSLARARPREPPDAEEGRPPHPRLAEEGEQEVRPQEGPQGAAVHQALIRRRAIHDSAVKFGTDGVRGVANTELTAAFALDLGRAAARVLSLGAPRPSWSVATRRISTPMLEAAFVAGLRRGGRRRASASASSPTPVVAFEAARRIGAMGAMISASHNPYRDNGIKLFAAGGTSCPTRSSGDRAANSTRCSRPSASPARIAATVDDVIAGLRRPRRRRSLERSTGSTGCAIVVDAANGAGARPWRAIVFERLGADVVVIHDEPGRPQHQRRLRRHRPGRAGGRGRRPRRRPRASPSTATPTG